MLKDIKNKELKIEENEKIKMKIEKDVKNYKSQLEYYMIVI